jgi:ABC-type nitrate/sulfonate/bicarbonate transport system substrate-binding protein
MARSERSHHLRLLVPIVALVLFAVACSSPAATPSASEPGASAEPAATDAPSASASAGGELPPAEQTSLRICHQPHISTLSTYLAASEGIFEKYGLDVELVPFEGDGPMGQALAAGQVDGCIMGAGPVLSAAAAGESLKMVVVVSDYSVDFLMTPDTIQSGDDLRGQQVAISTYGGESHTIVLFALQSLGLTADDVTIVQVGGQGDRYAALQAGAVQAAPIEGIPDEELAALGLHKLVDLREVGERYAKNGLVFSASFIEENPNTVLRAVAAHLEALNIWLNDPELGIQVYMEAMEVDEDEARINVEPALDINPTGEMTADMFEVQKAALTAANPDIESVDTADIFDASFLEQLRELGFYEELGIE